MIFRISIVIVFLIINGCSKGERPEAIKIPNLHTEFQKELNNFQKKNGVKGIVVALFDSKQIIWKKVQGKTTYGFAVNDSTMFSLQSISKNITALAVMKAVEDGLLDLDTPISKYLPDFKVNSCYEKNPESMITLRMLLSHTAGFPHEAKVGNNYDYSFPSIEKHLESISESWLKFPVGTKYSYSNLGFDLAAQIIEKKSGIPFDVYLKTKIFQPLGMNNSTANDLVFVNAINKTEGTLDWVKSKHYPIPLIGSGAAYSSLNNMVKYTQLHLNFGKINGDELIRNDLLASMYKIQMNNYGLGTYTEQSEGSYYLNHNGGGFGYGSSILWFPEYNIGCVVLANKTTDCYKLAEVLIKRHLDFNNPKRIRDTLRTNEINPFKKYTKTQTTENLNLTCSKCKTDSVYKQEWNSYLGSYEVKLGGLEFKWFAKLAFTFGKKPVTIKVTQNNNSLILTGSFGESKLYEYEKGLFFTHSGAVLDLRSSHPTFSNLRLSKFK